MMMVTQYDAPQELRIKSHNLTRRKFDSLAMIGYKKADHQIRTKFDPNLNPPIYNPENFLIS